MTWTKLDDGFYDDPDVEAVGNAAAGAFCRMLSYCGRQLTDGTVPASVCRLIGATPSNLKRLEAQGFIERNGHGGCEIRSYTKFNPTREQVLAKREADKLRKAGGR